MTTRTKTSQKNFRLSMFTRQQLATLCELTGQSEANVISLAIDRLYMSPDMYDRIIMAEAEDGETDTATDE